MRNPVEVEAIVFRRNGSKIEFLLLKRKKEFGGFWQPLTGGNEDEESLIVKMGWKQSCNLQAQ
jgi:hypothetical protein